MMQLLNFFSAENYEIHFGSTAATTEYSANLEAHKIRTYELRLNDPSFDDLIADLMPDIVLFDRFISEEQFGWRVAEICPNAMRILDTEDLHFLREAREKAVKQGISAHKANVFTDLAKRELASIYRCDLSLIISEFEMDLLVITFHVPRGLLLYLPIGIDRNRNLDVPGFNERSHFVTIGNFRHAPNLDSVLFTAKSLWPEIRKHLPEAELHVYGAYVPKQVSQLHDESKGFLVKGWANEVSEVMKSARICLAPLRFGAGLKGKILDAFSFGTPVVTTPIGAEGIAGTLAFGGQIKESISDIVDASIELFTSEEKWDKAQDKGIDIISDRFKSADIMIPFQKKVNELRASLGTHRKAHFIGQVFQHQTIQASKYMSKWIEQKNKK